MFEFGGGNVYKAVVFDLDGTLLDTERLNLHYKLQKCSEMGVILSEIEIKNSFGLGKKEATKYFKNLTGREDVYPKLREFRRTKTKEYIIHHGLPFKEYARQVLDQLKEKGILIGLATSSEKSLLDFYNHFYPLYDKFDVIVTNDQIKNGKPNKDIFEKAFNDLKIDAKQALVIEDSYNGLLAAKRAGADSIFIQDVVILSEEQKNIATYIENSLLDILKYV